MLLLLLMSCQDEEVFFLRNNGADMPVIIQGNKASGVFVVFLHGGPGNGTYIWEKYFDRIETEYAVAYWNQRAAGESQGHVRPSQMTISQFVEDLDQVIALINHRFGNPRIFLMGHSWGGLLGTAYLVSGSQNADEIVGWIEVDGAHNKPMAETYSRQWVIDYANQSITSGSDVAYWTEAVDWYNTYTGRLTYTSRHYTEYLESANAYFYGEEVQWYDLGDFLFGRPNGMDLLQSQSFSDEAMEKEVIDANYSPLMGSITIPALVLWGRHDGAIPYPLAVDAYNALGTSPTEKRLVIFDRSAHSPMIEENEAFCSEVISFVNQHK